MHVACQPDCLQIGTFKLNLSLLVVEWVGSIKVEARNGSKLHEKMVWNRIGWFDWFG